MASISSVLGPFSWNVASFFFSVFQEPQPRLEALWALPSAHAYRFVNNSGRDR